MPSAPPTSEPAQFTAGETLAWSRSLPDYPATTAGLGLTYYLQAPGRPLITISAQASGAAWAVSVPAATTANYAAAGYTWTACITDGSGARTVIERGFITILPSPLQALGDTHASRTVALLELAIEGRIPNGLEHTNIDGQELQRIPLADLVTLRAKYRVELLSEQRAARAALGRRTRRTIGFRFVRP